MSNRFTHMIKNILRCRTFHPAAIKLASILLDDPGDDPGEETNLAGVYATEGCCIVLAPRTFGGLVIFVLQGDQITVLGVDGNWKERGLTGGTARGVPTTDEAVQKLIQEIEEEDRNAI